MNFELQAKNRLLNEALKHAYAEDQVKGVYTPFETLGDEMIQKIPDVSGDVLVLSDAGLLVALLRRLHAEGLNTDRVMFIAHTEEVRQFVLGLEVECAFVKYNELQTWFKVGMKQKFNIIVGNPPYQNGGDAGNFVLWPLFIQCGVEALREQGHLLFVVPQTWSSNKLTTESGTKAAGRVREATLGHGTLLAVDFSIGRYFQGVASTFSSIHWAKNKNVSNTKTTVKTDVGQYSIDYSTAQWVPCIGDDNVISILNKTVWGECKKLELLNNGKEYAGFRNGKETISKVQNATFNFPIANTSAQYTKNQYLFSSVCHPAQKMPKVIFSDSGYAAPFFDAGEFGLGHHARAFLASASTAPAVISILNSKLIKFIASAFLSGTASSDVSLIMRSIPELPRAMNDDEIYDFFKFSKAEIALIETTVK